MPTVVFICGDTAASVERQDNVTRQRHFHKVSKQTESAFNEGRKSEFKETITDQLFDSLPCSNGCSVFSNESKDTESKSAERRVFGKVMRRLCSL